MPRDRPTSNLLVGTLIVAVIRVSRLAWHKDTKSGLWHKTPATLASSSAADSSSTVETRDRMGLDAITNLEDFFAGRPPRWAIV